MSCALPEKDFSVAKSELSDVMTSVVHQHQPQLIRRHRGKESMLLVRPDDMARWLETFRFRLAVTFGEHGVTIEVENFGVLAFGDSFEEALADTAEKLATYARRFFERPQFYAETDRARHYPWLLRFALTPPAEQVALLEGDLHRVLEREKRETLGSAM